MAAYPQVYDLRHLRADCQEPGSALEPYALYSSMGYFTFFHIVSGAGSMKQCGVCFFLPWAHGSSKPAAAGLPLWAQQAGDNQSIAAAAACDR